MDTTVDSRECGFINSEPCIAEFMGGMSPQPPALSDSPYNHSSINVGDMGSAAPGYRLNGGHPQPPPGLQGHEPLGGLLGDHRAKMPSLPSLASLKLPEYPWMKEKKNSRKGGRGGGVGGVSIPGHQPPPPPHGLNGLGKYRTLLPDGL